MIRNYFKTAWRSLLRNKSYAAINVAGLAIGIAACLLIFLIVQFETSFDTFHPKKDHIYRVITLAKDPDGTHLESGTPLPIAEGLRADFPELKEVAEIFRNDGSHYSIQNADGSKKKFKEDDAYYGEPQFYSIFNFGWLAGDKKTALAEPNTIALSQDEANKFFGDWHNAMGKTVRFENKTDLKVTGILQNSPANTDFPIKLVVSYATIRVKNSDYSGNLKDWVSTFGDNNCYIVLPNNLSVSHFNAELVAMAKRRKPAPYNTTQLFGLQALADMHYNGQTGVFSGHTFSKELLNIISLIGVFLLVIACVNFINLATAQAVNRSKEVGIRKVLGASVRSITSLLSADFVNLVLLSILIASPIAWLAMNKWLQGYTYHTPVEWWVFAVAGLGAVLIALLTVSFQSIKAALANPMKSLKTE